MTLLLDTTKLYPHTRAQTPILVDKKVDAGGCAVIRKGVNGEVTVTLVEVAGIRWSAVGRLLWRGLAARGLRVLGI